MSGSGIIRFVRVQLSDRHCAAPGPVVSAVELKVFPERRELVQPCSRDYHSIHHDLDTHADVRTPPALPEEEEIR